MPKFYNSFALAKEMLRRQTYCTGILKKYRRDNPSYVTSKKLKQGENISWYLDGVHIGKWRDYKEILYISAEFADEM